MILKVATKHILALLALCAALSALAPTAEAQRAEAPREAGGYARQAPDFRAAAPRFGADARGPASPNAPGDELWEQLGVGFNGPVVALAKAPNGDVYAGGSFTSVNGVAAKSLARWDGSQWSSVGGGVSLGAQQGAVSALATDAAGNLYVGGTFDKAGAVAAVNVARWNGAAWTALGGGLNNTVTQLYWDAPAGRLLAGGYFTGLVAQYTAGAWSVIGGGIPNAVADESYVSSIARTQNGTFYFGGNYPYTGGGAGSLYSWNGAALSMVGGGVNAPVTSLKAQGNTLYVGGIFTAANPQGASVPANWVAAWNGSTWSALGSGTIQSPGGGAPAGVYALEIADDGKLYAGGYFSRINGVAANAIAVWNGSAWSALGSGASNLVAALEASNGVLHVGGYFSQAGGAPSPGYARYAASAPTGTATQNLALASGWNLISLYVQPTPAAPEDMFAPGVVTNLLGYNNGYKTWRPGGGAQNSLTALTAGYGYWARAAAPATVSVTGTLLPPGHTVDLRQGWNLIGYWPAAPATPAAAFSNLAPGDLESVVGYSNGYKTYRPGGGAQNTLASLERGKGYWVRLNRAVNGFTYGAPSGKALAEAEAAATRYHEAALARLDAAPNMHAVFVTGRVAGLAEGAWVDVLGADGRVLGAGRVGASGELGLVPVYGDDPETPASEGAAPGEALRLRAAGALLGAALTYTHTLDVLTVEASAPALPTAYALEAAYPNPFNPETTIAFSLPEAGRVQLGVFDLLGREAARLIDGDMEAGRHTLRFSGRDLASGVYVYRLVAGGRVQTRTFTLVK